MWQSMQQAHRHRLALQVLFGMAGGIIAGFALGCTKLFNNKYKRLIGVYGSGQRRQMNNNRQWWQIQQMNVQQMQRQLMEMAALQ